MANEVKTPIPARLYNASVGGHICGTEDIIDDIKSKTQKQINSEVEESLGTGGSVDSRIASAVAAEASRAQAAEADRYTKSETYTKEEVHNLITTPNQEYVTVVATDQTTAATDVLPATGSADTIYRVGNWDGSQYDESVYTEYAWNGSAYVPVGVKSQVGEVYDISLNHAGATYADLNAALGTNGANIPQNLRKGGMSVKFVQSSDNKYHQFRYMGTEVTGTPNPFIDTANWQGMDNEIVDGSQNVVENKAVALEFNYLKKDLYGIGSIKPYAGWIDIGVSGTKLISSGSATYIVVPVGGGETIIAKSENATYCRIAILKTFTYNHALPYNLNNDFATGESGGLYILTTDQTITIPSDARYLVLQKTNSSGDACLPIKFEIDGKDYLKPIWYIIGILVANTVKITQQTLTNEQKVQVKQNIGIVSESVPTKNSTNFMESGGVYPLKETLDDTFEKETEQDSTTIERVRRTSDDFVYTVISSTSYGFVGTTTTYLSWEIIMPNDGYLYIDPNSYGSVGSLFRAGVTVDNASWKHYANGAAEMPTSESKWAVKKGDKFYVSIKNQDLNSSFIFQYEYTKITYELTNKVVVSPEAIQEPATQVFNSELQKQKIKIHYVSGTEFHVTIPQIGSDAVILHKFKLLHNEADLEYGDSQTAHVVTADIWNAESIWINNVNAIQGNVNFIYHNYYCHVGSLHGNEVLTMSKFLADGVEFNPLSSFDDIYCDVFRLIMSANVYKATTEGTPTLDENGHPIVDTVHTEDDTYRVNNIIDIDRNLAIKHDNTTFRNLHAGMLEGQASCFDTVTVCDSQYDTNEFVWNSGTGHFDITTVGESDNLYVNNAKKASNLIMYGKGIVVKQSLERFGVDDYNNGQRDNYIYCNFYEQANAPRLKIYYQPSITVPIDEHATREVFNNGDVIRCRLRREIEVNV